MLERSVLSIDVGGSYYKAALLGAATFEIILGSMFEHPSRSLESKEVILDALVTVVKRGLASVGDSYRIEHIAFDFPGPFDYLKGCARMSHKFQEIYEIPLTPIIRKRCGIDDSIPIVYHHDLHAFTYGACKYDVGRGYDSVFCVTIGTGLGTGCFRDGELDMKPDGQPKYPIFQRPYEGDIVEDYVSNRGLTAAYNRQGTEYPVADAKELEYRAIHNQDKVASDVYAHMGLVLGRSLYPLLEALEIEALIVGGQISRGFSLFGETLKMELTGCSKLKFIGPVENLMSTTIRGGGSIPVSRYEAYTKEK